MEVSVPGSRFWWEHSRLFADGETGCQSSETVFRKALKAAHTQEPRVITVDKNAAYPKATDELKTKKELHQSVELRQKKYLNNIIRFMWVKRPDAVQK